MKEHCQGDLLCVSGICTAWEPERRCTAYTTEAPCTAQPGCSWDGSSCGGRNAYCLGDERSFDAGFGGCESYDPDYTVGHPAIQGLTNPDGGPHTGVLATDANLFPEAHKNFQFCDIDYDMAFTSSGATANAGLTAQEVCSECGVCTDRPSNRG